MCLLARPRSRKRNNKSNSWLAALVKRAVGRSADLIGTKKVVQLHVVGRGACVTELHVSVEIEPYFERNCFAAIIAIVTQFARTQ